MSFICKRKCLHEDRDMKVGYYKFGRKRCTTCDYNMETNNLRCYCCGSQYRTKPLDWSLRHEQLENVRRN